GRSGRQPGTAVPESAARRLTGRAGRQGQDPFLRVVRVRTRTGHDLHGPFDDQLSAKDPLTVRGSLYYLDNPLVLGAGAHPSNGYISTQQATNVAANWSKVLSDTKVQEVRVGYNHFDWTRTP